MIDAHVHVFAKASQEFPREIRDNMPADREETVDKLLNLMANHGIEQAVLVQIGGTSLGNHSYLRHCLNLYPKFFKGIGLVASPHHPEDQMDRLAEDGGIVGFRLSEIGGPLDPLAPVDVRTFTTYPFWKHAADKDYIVWLYPRAAEVHLIPWLLDAFPELTVVFNHLMICPTDGSMITDEHGRPRMSRREFSSDMPLTRHNTLGLAQFPNVCVKLSGQYAFSQNPYPYLDLKRWHEELVREMGANRCMWATDFPWIQEDPGYGRLRHVLDNLLPDLDEGDRALIMGETARRMVWRD
jgi:predicted TIM-barrel fold metal-dependent hydrolase